MKTLTYEYINDHDLELFIKNEDIKEYHNILVQVFTSIVDEEFIKQVRSTILFELPQAKIIGTTTCGEISNNGAKKHSTVISFSIFKVTSLEVVSQVSLDTSYETGSNILKNLSEPKSDRLKLLISFTDGLHTNGEEYLNGISSINDDLIVSGGMAADNGHFVKTLVFTNDAILKKGAVAVALYNENLNVYTDYSFDWETVGKKHIVEKSVKNRVYQIGGMSAVGFYKHYLGDDIDKLLPAIGIEFPLVIKKDGINIARAVLSKHNDGSLSFAGNIPQNSEVQFGHGDVQMIINKGLNSVKDMIENPIESIFIYSCMARHALLQDDINLELLPLREIAPISGFFSYGEFYHNCKNKICNSQLLNQSMTIVAISEKNETLTALSPNIFSQNPPYVDDVSLHRTQALSVLIERTTKELEELNEQLSFRVDEEVAKNSEKDAILHVMKTQAQLGDMIEMIIHQWRQPLSAISTSVTSAQVYKEADILTEQIIDDTFSNILSYTEHLNSTVNDFRELFKVKKNFSTIKIDLLIEKTLTIIDPLIKKQNIDLIKDIKENFDINIPIGLMMQVLLNIIKNSIDILVEKSISDPKIQIDGYLENNNCIIKIYDNGGGIPEDILPFIFDKKFTTKDQSSGTGIGLDMSKTIIETKLNGSIKATNKNGWAIFTIAIPI